MNLDSTTPYMCLVGKNDTLILKKVGEVRDTNTVKADEQKTDHGGKDDL